MYRMFKNLRWFWPQSPGIRGQTKNLSRTSLIFSRWCHTKTVIFEPLFCVQRRGFKAKTYILVFRSQQLYFTSKKKLARSTVPNLFWSLRASRVWFSYTQDRIWTYNYRSRGFLQELYKTKEWLAQSNKAGFCTCPILSYGYRAGRTDAPPGPHLMVLWISSQHVALLALSTKYGE